MRLFDEDDPDRGLTLGAIDLLRVAEHDLPVVDANNRFLIQATGYAVDDSSTTVEVTIVPISSPAIVSDGDLTMRGNVSVLGTNGNVHSNQALYVGGHAVIDGDATASAGYTETGNPSIGGTALSLPVPEVRAADYRYLAHEQIQIVGNVTLLGELVIESAENVSALVGATGIDVSGSASITNNGTLVGTSFGVRSGESSRFPGEAPAWAALLLLPETGLRPEPPRTLAGSPEPRSATAGRALSRACDSPPGCSLLWRRPSGLRSHG